MPSEALRFGRRFFAPDVLLAIVELVAIGIPLFSFFPLDGAQRRVFLGAAPLALGLASLVWVLAARAWRAPIGRATRRRLDGEVLDAAARDAAYEAILRFPRRAWALRVTLWAGVGGALATLLAARAGFTVGSGATVVVVCATHAFGVNIFRALWYERILGRVRAALLPDVDSLQRFADGYRERLVLAGLATGALGVVGIAAFTYFFIPINLEQYMRLETWFPLTMGALTVGWLLYLQRLPRSIDLYLGAALSPRPADQPTREDPRAVAAYRAAQALPYNLALAKAVFWLIGEILLVLQATLLFAVDPENAALLSGEAVVITLGAALYEALWHRATMRPILRHIAARHRPAPETVRTPLSLRSKMLGGFGLVIVFACGLSMFLSFMQYKTMSTRYIQRESELRLDAVLTELRERGARRLDERAVVDTLKATLQRAPRGDETVIYYLPPSAGAHPLAVGRGPALPWTGEALMRRLERGQMELSDLQLSGTYARLVVDGVDLGAIALLLPGYRGSRGPATVPQVNVLIFSFLVLLGASMGLVVFVATDLTRPIRELERRAEAMARGDLTRPVVSATGEGDEVGRLTFRIEEMRRELNDKFRSSTEINLSLEQEVGRRTAELERRNKELKDALDQLRRAQDELVRSEKMASMGRLVAGIAHEINNPVNAVVNTVGPLEATLADLSSGGDAVDEIKEMIRVIQRGAKRTKEIVQALHNYSRGDDERVVEVDLHRGLDESLDLLRHHLKNGIQVERAYGAVGRVRGRTALNQVFMNLLTNAAQALGEKGTIRITTSQKEGAVEVRIADDGPGIPPEILPRIFDPFFTTKDVGQGSGLGLSIVHGIVERHGGTISVESEVGHGTTFIVSLPAAPPTAAA
jgi:signal transduction histidine kinase